MGNRTHRRVPEVAELAAPPAEFPPVDVTQPAGPAGPRHLILTIALDAALGAATIFGNADSAADCALLLQVLDQARAQIANKLIDLTVAERTAKAP